ncbi:hypothetical protein COCMIDRAFT_22158 [Bipolaris oryzae ATCC 44560]|uniref:Uncharacterized protein n=1 Tax=Bipolaris oryzae ATCC 44560 TaxID=930090 RepID=W6ZEN1_COCMI|nr:uncharacterized protein COCMIDRAFT_22158 [Bipolaris oryzae ATCC 44560]EUC50282.1 hypothetical protein COCMIDRAFT_22158 [Bipolaris oryzae ATCC 44560]
MSQRLIMSQESAKPTKLTVPLKSAMRKTSPVPEKPAISNELSLRRNSTTSKQLNKSAKPAMRINSPIPEKSAISNQSPISRGSATSKQPAGPKKPATPIASPSPVFRRSEMPRKPPVPKQVRKRRVAFAPDTAFEPGRRVNEFWRFGALYKAGKHANVMSGGWLDTSFKSDLLEAMLNLKVYATYTVDSRTEFTDIHDEFVTYMKEGKPISPGKRSTLRDHELCLEVMDDYAEYLERCNANGSTLARDELAAAKVLVVYRGQNGGLLGFQFLKDTWDDAEAAEYLDQLKDEIPPDNQGGSSENILDEMRKR